MTAILTDEMVETIERAALSFVATVDAGGAPNIAPIASLMAHDGALAFANMLAKATVANLRRNPSIAIAVVDVFRRRGFRFIGCASILPPGTADYDAVAERVRQYPARKSAASSSQSFSSVLCE